MDLKPKFTTYFSVAVFFAIVGIEQALVYFFSIGYVRGRYQVDESWINGLNGLFALTSVIFELIFGHLADTRFSSRSLLLVTNGIFIIGNILLSIDVSINLLLFARFLTGIASGVSGSLLGNILRATHNDSRLSLLIGIFTCRQLGLVIGSAIDHGLLANDYHFIDTPTSIVTTAGLTLALIGLLAQILYGFLYRDLETSSVGNGLLELEKMELSGSATSVRSYGAVADAELQPSRCKQLWKYPAEMIQQRFGMFARVQVLATLLIIFTISFSQTGLEFCFNDYTKQFYNIADNLSDTNASLTSIIMITCAIGFAYTTNKVARDPVWLGTGIVLVLVSLAWITGMVPAYLEGSPVTLLITTFPILFGLIGIPLINLSSFSILSKLTPDHNQCFTQSVGRCVDKIAFYLGVAFCSATMHSLYGFFVTLLSLNIITSVYIY